MTALKRFAALLLGVLLPLTGLPADAFAEGAPGEDVRETDGFRIRVENGEATIVNWFRDETEYAGFEFCVTIPDMLDGVPVTGVTAEALVENPSFEEGVGTVVLGKNLRHIDAAALHEFTGYADFSYALQLAPDNPYFKLEANGGLLLTADGATLVYAVPGVIDRHADILDRSDVVLSLPASVTRIEEGALQDVGIDVLKLPAGLTFISSADLAHTTVELDPENCAFVLEDGMLYSADRTVLLHCNAGREGDVVIPDGVTEIAPYAFSRQYGIRSVTVPEGCETVGERAFFCCSALTSVRLPASVREIGDAAFKSCESLASIQLPAGLKTLGDYAFCACEALTALALPEGLTSLGRSAVYLSGVTKLVLPASLAVFRPQFASPATPYFLDDYREPKAVTVTVNAANPYMKVSDGFLLSADGTALLSYLPGQKQRQGQGRTDCAIPDGVTTVGDYAFCNVADLASVTLPDSVQTVGDYAFAYCQASSLTLGGGLTTVGECAFAFLNWNGDVLPPLDLPEAVQTIGNGAFWFCNAERISIYAQTIGDYAFAYCPAALRLWWKNVTHVGDFAFQYSGLCGTQHIPDTVVFLGYGAFCGSGIDGVILSDESGIDAVPGELCSRCYDLRTVELPAGVRRIGLAAFQGTALRSVWLPEGLTVIEDYAFYDAPYTGDLGTRRFYLPASVTFLGEHAFADASECGYRIELLCPADAVYVRRFAAAHGYDCQLVTPASPDATA